MSKRMILLNCLLVLSLLCYSQQHTQQAERMLDFALSQRGDSIYTHVKEEDREILNIRTLSTIVAQLERQLGKYQSKGEWKTDILKGDTVYYNDMQFEYTNCRFLISFNDDLKINRFAFVPVPTSKLFPAEPILMDSSRIEERQIEIVEDKYKLPGTLALPKGQNNVPVVILVHGSGPHDRDETIGPNKPFRDIAWGLAKRGIASIRYDKRTFVYGDRFAPEGFKNYDTESCNDALAAINLAKEINEVDKNRIYVIGHSQGGELMPRIAERSVNNLAGIIIAAGPARRTEDILIEQIEYIASLNGPSTSTEKQIEEIKRQVNNLKKMGTNAFNDSIPLPLDLPYEYWDFANNYNPVEVAKSLSLPILILQGERDYNVTMEDFALWRASLFRKKNVRFKSYPKLNHLFQEGSGKATPVEYKIESTVASYFMDDIATWIMSNDK